MGNIVKIESLSARDKLDKESEFYLKVLDDAIKNKDNKNIAITGGYGSGKTTIIDSYFRENTSEASKMLRVSIATFNNELKAKSPENNILEQQILQQIFFQVNPNKIPNSKFTKISDLSFAYIAGILVFLLFTIAFSIFAFSDGFLNSNTIMPENIMEVILLIIMTVSIVVSTWLLIIFLRKLGVSKFGVANTTVEFKFDDGGTVFNHYLDEIIYLFRKSKYRYIIFEDLDRFRNVEIFERLRSLNETLNRSARLKGRDLKFIYALKDDVFTGRDDTVSVYNRTKFFDFILPTVKIMHRSNAESILLKKLENLLPENMDSNKVKQSLSKSLIEDISLFINDMRTLINICNEFEVFRMRLEKSNITYDHLFAFIVYKNIYPKDYSDLIENKGIVYEVFNQKEKIVENLREEEKVLRKKINTGIGSIFTNKNEIAMLFAKKRELIRKSLNRNGATILQFPSDNYTAEGLKIFNYLNDKGINGEFSLYQGNIQKEDFSDIESFVTINSVNFLDLFNEFEDKREIESKINELNLSINDVETKSISQLIKEDLINLHVNLKDKELLYFLLRNDWLNESYEDYLTAFRAGTISNTDKEFIQAIKLGKREINLINKLDEPRRVANKIRVTDIDINNIAVINVDLITYLLNNNSILNNEKLSKIIKVIFKNLKYCSAEYIRLLEMLSKKKTKGLAQNFLIHAIHDGVDPWIYMKKIDISKKELDNYALIILDNLSYKVLTELGSFDDFKKYMSIEFDVSKISDSEHVFELIDIIGIKFNSIEKVGNNVLNRLLKLNAYEINLKNLKRIFNTDTIYIETLKDNPIVKEYCFREIEPFILDVLTKQKNYNEAEDPFIKFVTFLSNKYIAESEEKDDYILKKLINSWTGSISDLTRINVIEILFEIYNQKKFTLTWDNINYSREVLSNEEIDFNINHLLISEEDWSELIKNTSKSVQKEFVETEKYNIFVNHVLSTEDENLEYFISNLQYVVQLGEPLQHNEKVIQLLIDQKILVWDMGIYLEITSKKLKEKYILSNLDDSEEDIEFLIGDEELVWSINIFKAIIEMRSIDKDIIENYIKYNFNKFKIDELRLISSRGFLTFDEEILEKLEDSKLLVEYISLLNAGGFKQEVLEFLNDHIIMWDKGLYRNLKRDNVDAASVYALQHDWQNNLDSIDDQELFSALLRNSDSNKQKLEIFKKYHFEHKINEEVADHIYNSFINEVEFALSKLNENEINVIINATNVTKGSKMLLNYLEYKQLNREELFYVMHNLKAPFYSIRLDGKHHKIDSTHENVKRLLSYLESEKVISSFKKVDNDQKYVVRNKRK